MARTTLPKVNNSSKGKNSKYNLLYDDQAKVACKEFGATDKQLASLFNVSEETINRWKKAHETFRQSVKDGRDAFDSGKVEKSLLGRALGYDYVEVRTEDIVITQGRGKGAVKLPAIKTTRTTKHVLPDVGAQCFWLKNRQPGRWKDIKAMELTGKDGIPLIEGAIVYIPDNKRDGLLDEVRKSAVRSEHKAGTA